MFIKHDINIITFRDAIEATLMEQFSGCLQELNENNVEYIEKYYEKKSGHLELIFLMSGQNRLSTSTHYPRGLIYKDKDAIFGVSVFFRSEKWEPCIHVIAPQGQNWQLAVDNFCRKVWEHLPEAEIFIRYTFLVRCDKLKPPLKLEPIETESCRVEIVLKQNL